MHSVLEEIGKDERLTGDDLADHFNKYYGLPKTDTLMCSVLGKLYSTENWIRTKAGLLFPYGYLMKKDLCREEIRRLSEVQTTKRIIRELRKNPTIQNRSSEEILLGLLTESVILMFDSIHGDDKSENRRLLNLLAIALDLCGRNSR